MAQNILSPRQLKLLELIGDEKKIIDQFYLTGGTALNAFYIPYRLSEDLDFFSEKEVTTESIIIFLRSIKEKLGFRDFSFNTSFNRNIFILQFQNEQLKLEFTYFPFKPVDKPLIKQNVKIDSILDIAVNKLFTIYQKTRSRDFMDLYMIIKKYGFTLQELIAKAKIKFDWHIDLIKLGSQLMEAKKVKDYPRLIEPLNEKDWQIFFEQEALKLGKEILS